MPGDFKRLKAKVGKRAPQRLNSTDTKFRTATVQVQSQSVTNAPVSQKRGGLVSSRGKNFSQLMAGLNHPSSNARSSALGGMGDAIKNTPDNVIPQHLSLIVPSLSKCFVDEDSGVRKLTNSILFQNVCPRIASCNMGGSMRPFLPLILAYVGSALHSLDQDVRYDGCLALEALCTNYNNLFMEGGDEIDKLQATIPAFTILLDDVSGGLASMSRRGVGSLSMATTEQQDKEKSKNRQKQSKKGSRAVGVLKSFLAVMKVTTSFHNGCDILAEDSETSGGNARLHKQALLPSMSRADLEFVKGGRTSNKIVWKKDEVRYTSMHKLDNLGILNFDGDESNSSTVANPSLDIKVQNVLFSKLRDRLVEVSQRGQPADKGIYLSPSHAQECGLVVSSLRLLWNGYSRKLLRDNGKASAGGDNDSELKKVKHVASSVLNLFLECFSIMETNGNDKNRLLYDSLNASICMALSEFGSVLDTLSGHNSSVQDAQWVKAIFSYVSPQLEEDTESGTDHATSTVASNTRVTLVKVVEQLLLLPENTVNSSTCLLSENRYMDLIGRFGSSYFSSTNFNDNICKFPEGRRAAALLISLINESLTDTGAIKSEKLWSDLMQMASLLPMYLMKWRGGFPKDTTVVLATLLAISRNCDAKDAHDQHSSSNHFDSASFCSGLRISIEKLFRTSKKERRVGISGNKAKLSVFEELSRAGQTMLVSLVGVLRFPSDALMACLSQICARRQCLSKPSEISFLDDTMIDYIMGVIQSINRTMTLQQYLTFLINSCGINSATYSPNQHVADDKILDGAEFDFVFSYDQAISRTCRYTLLTKSKKIVNSYTPILKSWLDPSRDEDKMIHLLKSRAAISILSCQALSYESEEFKSEQTIFHQNDLRICLCQAIYNVFLALPIGHENTDDHQELSEVQRRKLTSPVVVLLRCVPFLLTDLVDMVVKTIKSSDQDVNAKECLIHSLVFLVKSKDLAPVLRGQLSNQLQAAIKLIDEHTSSGPLHAASGILTVESNALLGFNLM